MSLLACLEGGRADGSSVLASPALRSAALLLHPMRRAGPARVDATLVLLHLGFWLPFWLCSVHPSSLPAAGAVTASAKPQATAKVRRASVRREVPCP